ncbi:MAG: hypothetical protein KZQ99_09650 [Candidatus Thiodiazotropha sp. (ex Dulcina madagascariensis)]|nr:hypothetical protein [Candidatus Thiodiazotropha sp. (ex Dulcina madagascariensis)]
MNRQMSRAGCILLILILMFSPMIAIASAGWTDYGSVTELTPTIHGRFIVTINVTENPSGCKEKSMFYQDYSITGSRHMFDTLLKAVTSRNRVRVFVTGRCELNGYAEISSVTIIP